MLFEGSRVVITGASGNLGGAAARAFHWHGARLALVGRDAKRLHSAFTDLDEERGHLFCAVDLTDPDATAKSLGAVVEEFGAVDVLINIAGGFRATAPVHKLPRGEWESMLDLNARSVVHAAQAIVPSMIETGGGKVINVGSSASTYGSRNMSAYAAAKAAVLRITESMSAELRDHNISVNCVSPGTLDTPQNRAAMPNADFSRWVSPDAVADVIVFLASDVARAIHGQNIQAAGLAAGLN